MLRILPIVLMIAAVASADRAVDLGDLTIRYDPAKWKAVKTSDGLTFQCVGKACRGLPVFASVEPVNRFQCTAEALKKRVVATYGTHEIDLSGAHLSLPFTAVNAESGCRNWVPGDTIACTTVGASSYVFASGSISCRGPSSDGAEIMTILAGARMRGEER